MFPTVLQVALGGAIGAAARYGLGVALARPGFPVGVLGANILGSFAMGIFVALITQRGLPHLSPFVATGLLGGFTTFSAFSLEAVTLYQRGDVGQAAVYVALSVVLSIGALLLGVWMVRGLG